MFRADLISLPARQADPNRSLYNGDMGTRLAELDALLNDPVVVVFGFVAIAALVTLKGFALWKAASARSVGWFIALLVINSLGVLELVYLLGVKRSDR